jgi:RHS repeat-associated protein
LLTGPSGERLEQRAYEPYGVVVRTLDGSVSQSFELAPLGAGNKPTDPHTLWSDHGARWLSPETVRWLSVDPLALAPGKQPNVTPYGYGNENPILFWDPDGNAPKAILDLIDAGVITGDVWDYSSDDCKQCYRTVIKSHVATFSINGGLRELTTLGWLEKEAEYDRIVSDVRLAEQERVNKVRATVQKGAQHLQAAQETVWGMISSRGRRRNAPNAGGDCFVPGTLVWTAEGTVAIEDVQINDVVLCLDPRTDDVEWCEVNALLIRPTPRTLIVVSTEAGDVVATADHPFWVAKGDGLGTRPLALHLSGADLDASASGRWVDAGALRVGDLLQGSRGNVRVVALATRPADVEVVYNLNVDGASTYFVGPEGVLVHNRPDKYRGDKHGGGKNAKHANANKRAAAAKRYEALHAEWLKLKSTPNKTKEISEQIDKLERAVKKAKKDMDFTGENHSQKGK